MEKPRKLASVLGFTRCHYAGIRSLLSIWQHLIDLALGWFISKYGRIAGLVEKHVLVLVSGFFSTPRLLLIGLKVCKFSFGSCNCGKLASNSCSTQVFMWRLFYAFNLINISEQTTKNHWQPVFVVVRSMWIGVDNRVYLIYHVFLKIDIHQFTIIVIIDFYKK